MRTFAVALFATILLLAGKPCRSQQNDPPKPSPGSKPERPPAMNMPFPLRDALDKDGDGRLSAKEIEAAAESLKTLDRNKDGKLDAEELGWPPRFPGFGQGGPGGPGFGPGGLADGPGKPDAKPGAGPGFGPGDRRGGGGRGPGGPGFGGPGGGRGRPSAPLAERLLKRDSNGDGKITESEIPGSMRALIARGDLDHDGALDKSELAALAEQLGEARSTNSK